MADVDAELISRRITVEIAVDPGLDPIRVDRAGIRDALAELVRNALDALPDRGGRMTLRAAPAGDAVSLEVADDGAGISPDVFARLECGAVRSRGLRVATTVARAAWRPVPDPQQIFGRHSRPTAAAHRPLTTEGTVMRVRVLVAPSGFKESLSADEVADSIAIGIRRAVPDALVRKAPMADGGEGFAAALALATGGQLHPVRVTGPVGKKVDAAFAMLGGDRHEPTAVFEMAAAAGLRLVPRTKRDPLTTTTRGVGEMLLAALDEGARRVLIGCGDSGTNDGDAGMAQALGVHLHDEDGNELGAGGGELQRLASIDVTGRDPRIADTDVEVACNWTNVLTGPQGVAQVYGPQKGASPETVERLEQPWTGTPM